MKAACGGGGVGSSEPTPTYLTTNQLTHLITNELTNYRPRNYATNDNCNGCGRGNMCHVAVHAVVTGADMATLKPVAM